MPFYIFKIFRYCTDYARTTTVTYTIGSAVFANLTSVIDRQTDRQTTDHASSSVTTGHIYVRSTALRSNSGS